MPLTASTRNPVSCFQRTNEASSPSWPPDAILFPVSKGQMRPHGPRVRILIRSEPGADPDPDPQKVHKPVRLQRRCCTCGTCSIVDAAWKACYTCNRYPVSPFGLQAEYIFQRTKQAPCPRGLQTQSCFQRANEAPCPSRPPDAILFPKGK